MTYFEIKKFLMKAKILKCFLIEFSQNTIDVSSLKVGDRRAINKKICKISNDIEDLQDDIFRATNIKGRYSLTEEIEMAALNIVNEKARETKKILMKG